MLRTKLLWLDDARYPPTSEWIWVKTVQEAIDALKTEEIYFASLDHDLLPEHYSWDPNFDYISARLTTGWMVTRFLLDEYRKGNHSILPTWGVRIHSMNYYRVKEMLKHIKFCYGRTFQCEHDVLPWKLEGQEDEGWWKRFTTQSMIERYRNCQHSA